LTGEVIGECKQRHRHQELLLFLKTIEAKMPKIMEFIAAHNSKPKPFLWTKTIETILEKKIWGAKTVRI
jgi:hypothetical protein